MRRNYEMSAECDDDVYRRLCSCVNVTVFRKILRDPDLCFSMERICPIAD